MAANDLNEIADYRYRDSEPTWSSAYLWPVVRGVIAGREWSDRRAFEVGCGNGSTANWLSAQGFSVSGVDPSESGIGIARAAFPHLDLAVGSAYDDLAGLYGRFPLVLGLEVIEHCFEPRRFARSVFELLEPGGVGIVSTPYHGYLKNLAISLAGKWDHHFTALWDGGHIKFFSRSTLYTVLSEAGFQDIRFIRAGRIPALAKSLVAVVGR